jgi:superfamily II DNA helicase RecQ
LHGWLIKVCAQSPHAGMEMLQRQLNQKIFLQEEVVMVATVARDESTNQMARFVAHLDLPKA